MTMRMILIILVLALLLGMLGCTSAQKKTVGPVEFSCSIYNVDGQLAVIKGMAEDMDEADAIGLEVLTRLKDNKIVSANTDVYCTETK